MRAGVVATGYSSPPLDQPIGISTFQKYHSCKTAWRFAYSSKNIMPKITTLSKDIKNTSNNQQHDPENNYIGENTHSSLLTMDCKTNIGTILRTIIGENEFLIFNGIWPFGNLGIGIWILASTPALQNLIFVLRNFFDKIKHLCPWHLSILPCA